MLSTFKKVSSEVQFGRFQVDWSLKIESSKCRSRKMTISTKNSDTKIRITDIKECAKKCRGVSSLFIFGTRSLGCSVYGCECHCEIDASSEGSCAYVPNKDKQLYSIDDTVSLYQFDEGNTYFIVRLVS